MGPVSESELCDVERWGASGILPGPGRMSGPSDDFHLESEEPAPLLDPLA